MRRAWWAYWGFSSPRAFRAYNLMMLHVFILSEGLVVLLYGGR